MKLGMNLRIDDAGNDAIYVDKDHSEYGRSKSILKMRMKSDDNDKFKQICYMVAFGNGLNKKEADMFYVLQMLPEKSRENAKVVYCKMFKKSGPTANRMITSIIKRKMITEVKRGRKITINQPYLVENVQYKRFIVVCMDDNAMERIKISFT